MVFTLEYVENAIQKIGRVMMYYDIELNEIEPYYGLVEYCQTRFRFLMIRTPVLVLSAL